MTSIPRSGEVFKGDDGTVSTVLADNFDPNYEPPEEELNEYARYIGIDVDKEPDLMWIAREGLRTPLPPDWRACQTGDEEIYYFNFKTGESLWDHPMDENFKQKVIDERAKLKSGGGKSGKRSSSTSNKANQNETKSSSNNNAGVGGSGAPKKGSGVTKALSAQLMGTDTSSILKGGGSQLGMAPLHEAALHGGQRALPDILDILPNTGVAAGKGLGSPGFTMGGGSGLGRSTSASASSGGPMSVREIEANIRKRVEEEYTEKRRQLSLHVDKTIIEQKHKNELDRKKLQKTLDDAFAADSSPTNPEREAKLQAEVDAIEQNWKTRIADLESERAELEKKVQATQSAMAEEESLTIEELKLSLFTKNEEALKKKREELEKSIEKEIVELQKKHQAELNDLAKQGATALEAAKKQAAEKQASSAKESAAQWTEEKKKLEIRIRNKTTELQAAEKRKTATLASLSSLNSSTDLCANSSTNKASPSGSPTSPAQAGPSEEELNKRQAEAQEELRQKETQYAQKLEELKKSYDKQEADLRASIAASKKATSTAPAAAAPAKAPAKSSAPGTSTADLSPAEKKKLAEEEEKLKASLKDAEKVYKEQTDRLVQRKLDGSMVTASSTPASPTSATTAKTPTSALTSTPPKATEPPSPAQLQRAREAEFTRFFMAMKQIESKHELAAKSIRDKHQKALAAAGLTDLRKSEGYSKKSTERRREWLKANPPNVPEVPKLDPVPRFSATIEDIPPVEQLSDEEKRQLIKERLERLREEMSAAHEARLAQLEAEKQKELDQYKNEYREQRLAEIRSSLDEVRKAAATAAAAAHPVATKSSASSPTTASGSPLSSKGSPAGSQRAPATLPDLSADIANVEKDLADDEATFSKKTETLKARLQELEASIKKRRAELATVTAAAEAEARKEAERAAAAAAASAVTKAPKPNATSGGSNKTKKKSHKPAEVRETVVDEPDFENYITNSESQLEENRVRQKWAPVLQALQQAVQAEMARYNALLQQQQTQQTQNTTSTVQGTAVALSSAVQQQQMQWGTPVAAAAPTSQSFSTPLNLSQVTDDGRGMGMGMTLLPGQAGYGYAPLVSNSQAHYNSLVASSIRQSPMRAGSVFSAFHSPLAHIGLSPKQMTTPRAHSQPAAQHHHPYPQQDAAGPQRAAASAGTVATDGPPSGVAPPTPARRDLEFENRMHHLKGAMREQRRELKQRQQQLETLRDEWRADMRVCRERRDARQAAALREIKKELEAEAHALNRDVLRMQAASAQLKTEEHRYQAHLAGEVWDEQAEEATALLKQVLRRTEKLEQAVRRQTRSSPPAKRARSSRHEQARTDDVKNASEQPPHSSVQSAHKKRLKQEGDADEFGDAETKHRQSPGKAVAAAAATGATASSQKRHVDPSTAASGSGEPVKAATDTRTSGQGGESGGDHVKQWLRSQSSA